MSNSRERGYRLYRPLLTLVSACLLASSPPLRAQEGQAQPAAGSQPTVAESEGDSEIADANQRLMTLSTLSDKEEALRVFGDALSTIAARRDPSSLPALEALINTRGSGFLSPAEEAAHALRPKASELWLDLKREVGDLSIAEIFYGLVPDSPVRLSPGLSRQAVEASGAEGRAYLLRTLTRPDLPFDGWRHGVMAYQMSQVLDDPGFALTDAEVSRVVTEGGAYGRAVVLHHLPAEKASKLRACSSPSSRRRAHRATWSFSSDCSAGSNRCRRAWRIAAGRFC